MNSFREYASTTRTVERCVIDDDEEEGFALRHLREIVEATADYDEDSFIRAFRAEPCEDGFGYWIGGLNVQEISKCESRGDLVRSEAAAE